MIEFMLFACFLLVLGVGGVISDYVFPAIKPLERCIDRLPMMQEENAEEAYILMEEEAS